MTFGMMRACLEEEPNYTWYTNTEPVAFATDTGTGGFSAAKAFDTDSNPLIDYAGWQSAYGSGERKRLYVDLGSSQPIGAIRIINWSGSGNNSTWGLRECRIYVSDVNPTTVFESNLGSATKIFDGNVPQASAANGGYSRYHILPLSNTTTSGRYVIFDTYNTWLYPSMLGGVGLNGVNRIEIGQVV